MTIWLPTHIKQPHLSKTCGQHCVAMLCDIPVKQAIKDVGKSGGTYWKDLLPVFNKYRWVTKQKSLFRFSRGGTDPLIALIKSWNGLGNDTHWMLKYKSFLYDPSDFVIKYWPGEKYYSFNRLSNQRRITSYLELFKED